MINNKLHRMYKEKIDGLKNSPNFSEKVDGPILMHCWEEDYQNSKVKILFVGQECNGWIGYMDDNVEESLKGYKNFEMSKNGNTTIFWQYVNKINSALNPNSKNLNNFLWTNVSKFSTLEGTSLNWDTHVQTVGKFDCLEEEIKIISPDVILFLSGPNYDNKLKIQFSGQVNFKQFGNRNLREVAKLEYSCLPKFSFRLYHPNYLQRSKKYYLVEEVIEYIKKNINH